MKKTILIIAMVVGAITMNAQTKTVELEKLQGLYIVYPGQKPTFKYELVQSIKAPGVVKSYKVEDMNTTMLKQVYKKEIKNGDALIYTNGSLTRADVVKFKD